MKTEAYIQQATTNHNCPWHSLMSKMLFIFEGEATGKVLLR
jgi:hypothetical protein